MFAWLFFYSEENIVLCIKEPSAKEATAVEGGGEKILSKIARKSHYLANIKFALETLFSKSSKLVEW